MDVVAINWIAFGHLETECVHDEPHIDPWMYPWNGPAKSK